MKKSTGYVLYRGKYTRSLLSEMVLAEGGIDYQPHDIDIFKKEHRDPEFLRINPAGFVPVLMTPEGKILHETPAINLFLAERHDIVSLVPPIDDPLRGSFMTGLFVLAGELEPALKRMFYPHRYAVREGDQQAVEALSRHQAERWFDHFESCLTNNGPYFLGERYSLVDLTLCFWAAMLDGDGVFGTYPVIRKSLAKVRERPATAPHFKLIDLWASDWETEAQSGSEFID